MADDREIGALDPFDLFDREASRLDAHFSSLAGSDWMRPSRCAGWTVRDLLGHLLSVEAYFGACLDGTVRQLSPRATPIVER